MRMLIAMCIPFSVWVWAQVFGPALEGRYFPVVSDFEVTEVRENGSLRTIISGVFFRIRSGCDFEEVHFRLGDPTGYAKADHVFIETTKVRDEGWHDFGPWDVQLTAEQLMPDRSYAVALHTCHPFWKTETRLY